MRKCTSTCKKPVLERNICPFRVLLKLQLREEQGEDSREEQDPRAREMTFGQSIEEQIEIFCAEECGPLFSRLRNQCERYGGGCGDGW